MKRFLIFSLIIVSQLVWASNASELEFYINKYKAIKDYPTKETTDEISWNEIVSRMDDDAEAFRYFLEGPYDGDGEDNPAMDEWYKETYEARTSLAIDTVEGFLERPTQLNDFTLEIMDKYLFDRESRLPLMDIVWAFEKLKPTDAYLNQVDMANDWRPITGTSFVTGGGITLAVLCIRRRSMCSKLARQADFIREVRRKAKSIDKKKATKLTGKQWVSELRRRRGLSAGYKNMTLGGAVSKASFYKEYLMLGMKSQIREMKYVLYAGGAFGAAGLAGQTAYNNFREGKYEYTRLSPAELELKYFGALAVVEMTCRAREILNDDDANFEETRDFLLDSHRELLVLGRMSGSTMVYDKTLLSFAFPVPETDQIRVEFSLADDKDVEHIINCPGVAKYGDSIHASLDELEQMVKKLRDKAIELGKPKPEESEETEEPTQEAPVQSTPQE